MEANANKGGHKDTTEEKLSQLITSVCTLQAKVVLSQAKGVLSQLITSVRTLRGCK